MTNETTASQPKSIGDDAQFLQLLTAVETAPRYSKELSEASAALIIAIDSKLRAPAAQASATIQAAPDDMQYWIEAAADFVESINAAQPEIAADTLASALRRLAATIQEPVMVAEPVGEARSELSRKAFDAAYRDYSSSEAWNKSDSACHHHWTHLAGHIWRAAAAAPMVADPAGVAVYQMRTEGGKRDWVEIDEEKFNDLPGYGLYSNVHKRMLVEQSKVATVKAVPSEALEGACTVCTGKGCSHCDGMGLEPRKVVGYAECRCILKQYCDGQCRPIFADQQPVTLAAPLADKTGGGE